MLVHAHPSTFDSLEDYGFTFPSFDFAVTIGQTGTNGMCEDGDLRSGHVDLSVCRNASVHVETVHNPFVPRAFVRGSARQDFVAVVKEKGAVRREK